MDAHVAVEVFQLRMFDRPDFDDAGVVDENVYRPEVLLADHMKPVKYEIPLQPPTPSRDSPNEPVGGRSLYIHAPRGRAGRAIDAATERFVDETRMGATP